MAIALAALEANNVTTETESDFEDELTTGLTESSENLFLRNLSQIIANSEQTSTRENQLSITEVPPKPQPQFGFFLPISCTPKLHSKRFLIWLLIHLWHLMKHVVDVLTGIRTNQVAHLHHWTNQIINHWTWIITSTVDQSVSAHRLTVIMDVIK